MGRNRSRSMSSSSSGRGAQSSKWDGATGHRIHVADLAAGISRREVERAFAKFGPINEVWVATNPPCFAFINFTHRNDAEKAIREVDGKVVGSTRVGVSWARNRTFGGRNRGGRGAPFGSYRSSGGGGGGSRRRSRSRSPSDSRRQKRRHSRSRSRDRHRRRSESPRDRKRSRRTSKEKNGSDRRKSKTPSSPRRDSTPKKESTNDSKKRSRSRDASIDAESKDSPSIARPDENNTHNRSPLTVDDE